MSNAEQERYEQKMKRVWDAIQLRQPDMIPIIPVMQAFPVFYAGNTMEDAMRNQHIAAESYDKFFEDFDPDLGWDPVNLMPTEAMATLDLRWGRWPGHGLGPNYIFQFLEGEYMRGDEYEELIYDPTHFFVTKWIPRSFGALEPLKNLTLRNSSWMGWVGSFLPFASEEMRESLDTLMAGARMLKDQSGFLRDYQESMKRKGIPLAYGGFAFAPFDILGDTLRGTKGVLVDMIRKPDLVLQAVEKLIPIAIDMGVSAAKASGNPFIWIWLHKGGDEFMSPEQYRTFYWPSLKALLIGIIDAGCTPVVYAEGKYDTRLSELRDVPPGKVVYDFEYVNMAKAKEVLGDVACIAGNVPNSLLMSGEPSEVESYCKRLIKVAGKGGGFMMDTGALVDNAKPENLKMMFDVTRKYGTYS